MPAKMGTEVIDKLRIQGSAASLRDPAYRKPTKGPSLDINEIAKHFTFHQSGETTNRQNGDKKHQNLNTPNVSHPNSAPSRKQNFLQRVQEANRGLTSSEYPQYSNDYTCERSRIQFLLRGKPVNSDEELVSASPHKRVGHYKTSTTEAYRARHRFRDMSDFYEEPNFLPVSQNDAFFYLGPQASTLSKSSLHHSKRSPPSLLPHSAPGLIKGQSSSTTGEKVGLKDNNNHSTWHGNKSIVSDGDFLPLEMDDENRRDLSQSDFYDLKPHPHPTPVSTRRKQSPSKTKSSFTDTSLPDPALLNQCLHVHRSHKSDSEGKDQIHVYQKGFRGKPNPNFPARQTFKSLNNNSFGIRNNNKYFFNSVESYVHFNKIYPQVESSNNSINAQGIPNNVMSRTHIPRIDGFSPHCTDTLLLKMMFEMNKPPRSVKSVSKYSDVAVHKDLDEFMIVGTPSVSRSTSVTNSVNTCGLGQRAASQNDLKSQDKIPDTAS